MDKPDDSQDQENPLLTVQIPDVEVPDEINNITSQISDVVNDTVNAVNDTVNAVVPNTNPSNEKNVNPPLIEPTNVASEESTKKDD